MKRRDVLKGAALAPFSAALLSASRTAQAGSVRTKGTNMAQAKVANTPSRGAGTGKVPGFAEHLVTSDMDGLGPDGKPTGQKMTFTGASKADATAQSAEGQQMKLTKGHCQTKLA